MILAQLPGVVVVARWVCGLKPCANFVAFSGCKGFLNPPKILFEVFDIFPIKILSFWFTWYGFNTYVESKVSANAIEAL